MCSEHLMLRKGLFKLEVWCVKQNLIPYMGQLLLLNVIIEGWIIDHDIHVLSDGPFNVVRLPAHNGEIAHPAVMTCGVGIVINGGRSPEMFLKPLSKGSLLCLYLCITPLLCAIILVLWHHQEDSDGITSLIVDLHPHFNKKCFQNFH